MKLNLEAGISNSVGVVARYFRIMTAISQLKAEIISTTGETYFSGEISSGVGLNFSDRLDFPNPVGKIILTSVEAQTVDVFAELAKVDDDRLSGNFDINAALSVAQTAASKELSARIILPSGVGIKAVLPARATRRSALVYVESGKVNISNLDGIEVLAGSFFTWNNQAELNVHAFAGYTMRYVEFYD